MGSAIDYLLAGPDTLRLKLFTNQPAPRIC